MGYDRPRTIELNDDGTIGRGNAAQERFWSIDLLDGKAVLSILGDECLTCRLIEDHGIWKGAWLHHECMPIELTPLASGAVPE